MTRDQLESLLASLPFTDAQRDAVRQATLAVEPENVDAIALHNVDALEPEALDDRAVPVTQR